MQFQKLDPELWIVKREKEVLDVSLGDYKVAL